MKGPNYKYMGDLVEDDRSRLNIGDNVLLFFDESNSVMQHLLHLDYFEYEQIKNKEPERINELYFESEISLFDNLIEPISKSGKHMRTENDSKTNYWSAIPGGIPSFLINGVCIKNNKLTDEEIDEINKLFPNATIFDANLNIKRYPLTLNEESKKIY